MPSARARPPDIRPFIHAPKTSMRLGASWRVLARLGAIIFGHVSTVLNPFANVCFLRWLVHYVIDEVS